MGCSTLEVSMATRPVQPPQAAAERIISSFARGVGLDPDRAQGIAADTTVISFRPDDLIPLLLETASRCGAVENDCTYVSTPITTGRDRLDVGTGSPTMRVEPQSPAARVEANRRHAYHVAERIRGTIAEIVIEPASLLDIPDWTQDDYLKLWVAVLDRFARQV